MRQIKQQRPGIAIVIANTFPTASDRQRFLAAGAVDVLINLSGRASPTTTWAG